MQAIVLSLVTLASASAFAAQSTIYCKGYKSEKIMNAFSEDGHFDCAGALVTGTACFTGDAAKVAAKIVDINWDEEWLEGGYVVSKNEIGYIFKDGPNELQEEVRMDRCTDEFFKK